MKQLITQIFLFCALLTGALPVLGNNDKPAAKPVAQQPAAEKFDFQLYPNPCDGKEFQINVEGIRTADIKITLYSVIGNVMLQKTVETRSLTTSVQINPDNSLAKGVYFLCIQSGNEKITKRLIVNN
ncbi:MAG: T9SS type A sorting domain-containing protein [Bernardetiaceae bacterium]|jgi:hypothetical protein|nr:T9SS type A sorting domain-containing protein [Bernardetiaceae bacterium]